jgi:maltose-binding protein MalE
MDLTDDFQIAFQEAVWQPAGDKTASESQEYKDHLTKYPFMAGFVNGTPYGVSRPPLPQFGDIGTAFTKAWDSVILNDADVKETFTALQTEVNGILGK